MTTRFLRKHFLVAEGTIANALVTRQAIVVAFMKAALDTKEVAGGTFRPAESNASTEVYHSTVERFAQLFLACILSLETLCVQFQPLIDVGNA